MADVRDIKEIMTGEQPEFDSLFENIDLMQEDMFIDTVSEEGIKRFEKMLGIEGSNLKSPDLRRFILKLRLVAGKRANLKSKLNSLVGSNNYTMNYDINSNTLVVRIVIESKSYLDEVKALLDKLVPCNVIIDVRILYLSHEMMKVYTHEYLSNYKNDDVKTIGM